MEPTLKEVLAYAYRVARAMYPKHTDELAIGMCAWDAWSFFDPTRGVPWKRYVARRVRMHIWDHWRRKAKHKEEQKGDVWWEDNAELPVVPEMELPISPWEQTLLWERFVEKLPVDVMARRRGVDIATLRLCIDRTVERLRRNL